MRLLPTEDSPLETGTLELSHQLPLHSERVPYEIWLQVIECASLEPKDIVHLSLVSRFLRFVAQPMLFSEFRITLHRARYPSSITSTVCCQHVAYFTRLKKRLEFASMPRIVQAVKRLTISMGGDKLDWERGVVVLEESLIRAVFDHLHHFVNLRSLSAQDVSLTGSHFDALAHLKYFNGIHLKRCRCTGDLGLTRFRLKSLSLHGRMSGTYGWWIPLVRCPTLEHLSYDIINGSPAPEDDPEVLFPALSTGPLMHSLRTIRLPSNAVFLPCFQSALSRCPAIENLYIDQNTTDFRPHGLDGVSVYQPLRNPVLCNLKAVIAPSGFIEGCILSKDSQLTLKHIRITNLLYGAAAMGFLNLVRLKCPDLEELVVCLGPLSNTSLLDILLTSMPSLRGLHVTVSKFAMPSKDVYIFSLIPYLR
jgi:hypothetical protein